MDRIRIIKVSLVRHASAKYPEGILPPYDPDIDITNTAQLKRLVAALPNDSPWWVSPLQRCNKTAQALINHGGITGGMEILESLEEQRYGDWHGRLVSDIWEEIKGAPKSNWHFLHPEICPPNGESFVDLITRVTPVMDRIVTAKADHIVIIAHGMVIRALAGMALGFTPEQSLAISVDNLSLTQITYMAEGSAQGDGEDDKWHLNCLNQTF
jgi:broad specificity phosphatase PhoE